MTPYRYHPAMTDIEGIVWPGIPSPRGCNIMALLYQLQQSEWLPPQQIRRLQYMQANQLVRQAVRSVPFYRDRLAAAGVSLKRPLGPEEWRRIPLLTREDIQQQGEQLEAKPYPKAHGAGSRSSTSGSTGKPVTVLTTAAGQLMWAGITLRDHIWHGRELSRMFAAIRKIKGHDTRERRAVAFRSWQPPVSDVFRSGPGAMLSINTALDEQLKWLREVRPAYLLVYPTNLRALLDICRRDGGGIPGLLQIRTMAEVVTPELRAQCREVLGVEIADMYSSQECGYLALQCPGHDHYLVQAESCLLEVLRDDGEPCAVGETGRVVVTPLLAFAMPLLRYEIGDYATVGGASPCGRGLPVLDRIHGRVRNMMVQPDGQRIWPAFGTRTLVKLAPIRQYQFIQHDRHRVEARFALWRPFEGDEERQVVEFLRDKMPEGIDFHVTVVDEIPRSPGGKYEDFVCKVRD